MCTVSLIPHPENQHGFILTSNRDEASDRKTFMPDFKTEKGQKLLFPEDAVAGGSWIGASQRKRVLCLMNGGFVKHKRKNYYRRSRGLVLKDWLLAGNIEKEIEIYDLRDIEPFTVVIADWSKDLFFAEFVWDASQKHFKKLPLKPQIWSSSPLYNSEMKDLRKTWFEDFQNRQNLSAKNIWDFHHAAGENNKKVGLIMDRGFVKTKSVSQIEFLPGKLTFKYEDLEKNQLEIKEFQGL